MHLRLLLTTVLVVSAQAQIKPRRCNQPSPDPVVHVELPGHPFSAVSTRDGCHVFVSISATRAKTQKGVAVVQRSRGKVSLLRVVPTGDSPFGMTLTHDGRLVVLAAWNRLFFLDAGRLISGQGDAVLGSLQYEKGPGSIYVNVSRDDRLLFVSEESIQTITVIDLAKARATGFQPDSILGKIPTGTSPIALTFAPDGRLLYTTSQRAPESAGWALECAPEGKPAGQTTTRFPQGTVMVVDVARARIDPAHSVVAMAPAGCNPVRLALSPKGDIAYVTARGNHALLALDTSKVLRDPQHAVRARVPVGTSPVGVAVDREGRRVFATSSNRFAGGAGDQQFLTVVDAARLNSGAPAVLGAIPAGAFPRELRLAPDRHTLLVTNYSSGTLQLVDLKRVSLEPPPQP